ncbi:DUF4391 family protein [Ectothiorhodospiraceae bacterium BW-2]|nr:DUF4391 family protein [Ectothiorhodospiraceae bacterium BW-2]
MIASLHQFEAALNLPPDSIINHLIAYHAARHSGDYQPNHTNPQQRWQAVNQLDQLAKQQTTLRKKLKQERQMSRQIALNGQLRSLNTEFAQQIQILQEPQ